MFFHFLWYYIFFATSHYFSPEMANWTPGAQSPSKSLSMFYNNLACRAANLFEAPQDCGNLREAQRLCSQRPVKREGAASGVCYQFSFLAQSSNIPQSPCIFIFCRQLLLEIAVRSSLTQTGLRTEFSAEGGVVSVQAKDGRHEFFFWAGSRLCFQAKRILRTLYR